MRVRVLPRYAIRGRQTPVICIEPGPACWSFDRSTFTDELLAIGAKHEHTRQIRTMLYHRSFPVDIRHNAKIFREKLAVWAATRVKVS